MTKEDLEKLIAETPDWLKALAEEYKPSWVEESKQLPKLRIVE